jgi:DNA polymerase-3 subunit alpha
LKPKFIEGGKKNNHPEEVLEKIWKDWEAFAAYAFNKSHSTCYAFIAYQTAYLKAHYPAEYMASVLSNNMNDIKQVSFFMEECKRAGIPVLGPDINESFYKFSVNKDGAVRFGMGAIRGVGEGAVKAIVEERKENGFYKSIFDVTKRVDLRACTKKAFDGLVLAGGFDSFTDTIRAQYFAPDEKGITFIEKAIRFGNKFQESKNSAQVSLFGEASEIQFDEPVIPECEDWSIMEKLQKEKEMIGIYISGHPLDDYKTEMKYFCNASLDALKNINELEGRELTFAGIISEVQHRVGKNGKPWGIFTFEDYTDAYEFKLFNEEYLKFRHFLIPNSFLYLKISLRRAWQGGDVRVSFSAIQQLQDVLNKMAKKITIQLDIKGLDNQKVTEVQSLLKGHKGNQILNFTVYDMKEKLKLTMPSRSTKIEISKELLEELNAKDFSFKLN